MTTAYLKAIMDVYGKKICVWAQYGFIRDRFVPNSIDLMILF